MGVTLTAAGMCLALNMFFEARSEPLMGQVMVAEVTMNRVADPRFPDNICDVVWQNKQFSWTHDGKHDNPNRMGSIERKAWREIQILAEIIMEDPEEYLPNTGSLFYHADYVKPYWVSHKDYVTSVGSHLFYK